MEPIGTFLSQRARTVANNFTDEARVKKLKIKLSGLKKDYAEQNDSLENVGT